MGLPEEVYGVKKKMNGDAALAALEEGWNQYKENLELRKNKRLLSPIQPKPRLDDDISSLGMSRKACILSIDGGGMRGIIPARVLSYIEDSLQKKTGNPDVRIADFFDIIAGTSVGGLIATMLVTNDGNGRPLFKSEEAWKLIAEKGKLIFRVPTLQRPFAWLRGILTPRYSTKDMEGILKKHLSRDGRELTLKDTVKPLLVPCYDLSSACAFLFSRADAMQTDSFDFALADICRATSAVPGFFKPSKLVSVNKKTLVVGIDGGLVMNNPAAAAVTHVLHNTAEFSYVKSVSDVMVLSLGTGLFDRSYPNERVRKWGAFQWVKPVARIVLDGISDMVDHFMSMAFNEHRSNYVRIQVKQTCL